MYRESCGYEDNGRVQTWLPYRSDQYSAALLHDLSQEELLGEQADKYYVSWYTAPSPATVSDIYFDLNYREMSRSLLKHTPSVVGQPFLVWSRNTRTSYRAPAPTRSAPHVS